MLTTSLLLLVAGVSEGRRDLPAEATAEGEPGRSDPASWWNGGPEGPTEGAQCPAEGAGGDHAGPEGLLQHQESGAREMWGRAEEDSVRGRFWVTLEKVKNFWSTRFKVEQTDVSTRNRCRLLSVFFKRHRQSTVVFPPLRLTAKLNSIPIFLPLNFITQ